MQTYVNQNGDVYISTMPRELDDIPVVPRPSHDAVYNFDTGLWEVVLPTLDEIRTGLSIAVQAMLDGKARARNYDGIVSACSYIASANPQFAAEAMACVLWRDAVWATCYDLLDKVMSGEMAIPTEDELLAMLPEMEWPS